MPRRPRRAGLCCRPEIGSKGRLSFRKEARRKARHPEVQHLLLPGGGGPAGPAWGSPSPDPPARLPPTPGAGEVISSHLCTRGKPPAPRGEQCVPLRGPEPQAKLVQEHPLSHQRLHPSSAKVTGTDGAFQRQPLPPDPN